VPCSTRLFATFLFRLLFFFSGQPMTQSSHPKIMVVGLDGLTFDRLLPLVKAGELPTFQRLLAEGASGRLLSVSNMATGPTWASFATGAVPPTHGILHDFFHGRDYTLTPAQGRHAAVPAFWQVAADAGRRVVVLNVPMSYPVPPLNGTILAGIDAPSERDPGFAYPAGTLNALRRQGIDYIIDCGMASFMQHGDVDGAWRAVLRETEGRTRAAEALLAADPEWDLFVTVYSLPDVWQHYYWTSPLGSEGEAQIRRAHQVMDEHLARLLALLPPDGVILLCSDHGFGPLHATRNALNQWLTEQGYAAVKAPTASRGLLYRVRDLVRNTVSFRRRQQLLAAVPWLRRRVETELRVGTLDFARTQIYAAMDHHDLWVNVAGRQSHGTVAAADVAALCADVRARLLAWRDDTTGLPYLDDVLLQPDAGAHLPDESYLPADMRLVWNAAGALPGVHATTSGDHEPEGVFLLAGGSIAGDHMGDLALVDIAPIALGALGVTLPATLDGQAPTWLGEST
jgi:predicted AlkP superfamily phosphohydrolase/phosphomutase